VLATTYMTHELESKLWRRDWNQEWKTRTRRRELGMASPWRWGQAQKLEIKAGTQRTGGDKGTGNGNNKKLWILDRNSLGAGIEAPLAGTLNNQQRKIRHPYPSRIWRLRYQIEQSYDWLGENSDLARPNPLDSQQNSDWHRTADSWWQKKNHRAEINKWTHKQLAHCDLREQTVERKNETR
jgi:hypothetical protein